MLPPTTPVAPMNPCSTSTRCIEPPSPRQSPASRPISSASTRSIGAPFAMQCPCARWPLYTGSSSRSCPHTLAATPSCPTLRWIRPCTWSARLSTPTRSSKWRMRHIERRTPAAPSGVRATGSAGGTVLFLRGDRGLSQHLLHGADDLVLARENELLHRLAVRDRGLERRHL